MPIDFSLTEEQRQLQALARRFAKEVILPVAREYDEKEEVPWPVIEKLHEVGLLTIPSGNNVVRFLPALNLPQSQFAEGLALFERVIQEVR